MKLRQLQCLCAVVDAGFNISRAAAVVHATQPSVGKQLRQLEEALGTDVVLRHGGRLVGLTDAGERVLPWARRALQCFDNIEVAAQGSGMLGGGSIELATSHTHAKYVLLPTILEFRRRFPKVDIGLQQGSPEQVAELVRDGKVSFGVVHLPPQVPKEIVAVPFLLSRQVLVLPTGHPLVTEEELTLEKLASYPLIMQNPARPQGARILQRFQVAGLKVNVAVQALDADVMKTYVAAGLGIAVIPEYSYSAESDHGLCVREVGQLFGPASSAILLRRQSYLKRFAYAFLELLDPVLEHRRMEALVFED
jgi:LysR family cys regulon transcriptional activator